MKNTLLGTLSPLQFLKQHWQKKPLLIRNALPGVGTLLTPEELMALSTHPDVESRLVHAQRGKWDVTMGPFKKKDFTKLAAKWTLLVQGVNYFLPEAAHLIKQFNFIPHARLDDLMVSVAPDGGGVGPHFDSYDVFLIQGKGRRLWQISKQTDRSLVPDAPLRILTDFKPEEEWILEEGDMLYLPPNYAHNGVAIGDCMTYSVGFRAPLYQDLAQAFLGYLQDHIAITGIYADPDLELVEHPAQISQAMLNQVSAQFKKITFDKRTVETFLGHYLTEPKANLFFDESEKPLSLKKFFNAAKQKGIALDLKSQLLFSDEAFFMNGDVVSAANLTKSFLITLADERCALLTEEVGESTRELLYAWYLDGFIGISA